jgi:hypothetical protein
MLIVVMLSVLVLSLMFLYCYAECPNAECHFDKCHVSFIGLLSVVILNVVMLNVVTLSVVAPFLRCIRFFVRTMIKQTRGPYFKTFYSRNLWYAKLFTGVSQVHPSGFTHSFGP